MRAEASAASRPIPAPRRIPLPACRCSIEPTWRRLGPQTPVIWDRGPPIPLPSTTQASQATPRLVGVPALPLALQQPWLTPSSASLLAAQGLLYVQQSGMQSCAWLSVSWHLRWPAQGQQPVCACHSSYQPLLVIAARTAPARHQQPNTACMHPLLPPLLPTSLQATCACLTRMVSRSGTSPWTRRLRRRPRSPQHPPPRNRHLPPRNPLLSRHPHPPRHPRLPPRHRSACQAASFPLAKAPARYCPCTPSAALPPFAARVYWFMI